MSVSPSDQFTLVRIGRLVEHLFPNQSFTSMEDMRVFLNDNLGTNIQVGDILINVYNELETASKQKAFDRAGKII